MLNVKIVYLSVRSGRYMNKQNISNVDLTYEEALLELEEIIESFESNEHTLDEAVLKFERGQILAAYCSKLLNEAELKINTIMEDNLIEFSESL